MKSFDSKGFSIEFEVVENQTNLKSRNQSNITHFKEIKIRSIGLFWLLTIMFEEHHRPPTKADQEKHGSHIDFPIAFWCQAFFDRASETVAIH
uniref:Uncharacterized protein n=1 Tax=Romanomermis culicivorax TaxID=13658 RepID=A0A915KN53_ROMCU